MWCASALIRPGAGAVGDGATAGEALAGLRQALTALITESASRTRSRSKSPMPLAGHRVLALHGLAARFRPHPCPSRPVRWRGSACASRERGQPGAVAALPGPDQPTADRHREPAARRIVAGSPPRDCFTLPLEIGHRPGSRYRSQGVAACPAASRYARCCRVTAWSSTRTEPLNSPEPVKTMKATVVPSKIQKSSAGRCRLMPDQGPCQRGAPGTAGRQSRPLRRPRLQPPGGGMDAAEQLVDGRLRVRHPSWSPWRTAAVPGHLGERLPSHGPSSRRPPGPHAGGQPRRGRRRI